jgi:spore coat polysaccharide biosynthesis protein SpsF
MNEENGIIIQARMDSSRLPGKALLPVVGKPLLVFLLERLRIVKNAGSIVVATTARSSDDAICSVVRDFGVEVYRGSKDDVLGRFHECAASRRWQRIVRVTADCPLLDPAVVDDALELAMGLPENHFVTNSPYSDADRTYPRGMDVEVFSKASLHKAFRGATTQFEREHVTPFMRTRSDLYPITLVRCATPAPSLRLTVDERRDYDVVVKIAEHLYPINPFFSLSDIVLFLRDNPAISEINSGVIQKPSPL